MYLKLPMDFDIQGRPDKTRANRRGDYFTVGDVGEIDRDGYLFLRDRKIDMIISGGVNIYPAEVEARAARPPRGRRRGGVRDPARRWGEEVKAVVEPTAGAGDDLERRLLAYCHERLAKYKCPRSIEFRDALPRDPNGKLYKRLLRDPYWEGRDRRI